MAPSRLVVGALVLAPYEGNYYRAKILGTVWDMYIGLYLHVYMYICMYYGHVQYNMYVQWITLAYEFSLLQTLVPMVMFQYVILIMVTYQLLM